MIATRLLLVGALALTVGCASDSQTHQTSASPAIAADALVGSYADTKGSPHDISAILRGGKPVALVFWQPWCGACIAEAPTMIAAHERLGEEIEFFGVVSGPDDSVDEDSVSKAIFDTGMTYPTIRDRDLRLTKGLGVEIQPTIIILDPEGTVAYRGGAAPSEWH